MCMLAAAANITAMDQILLPDSRISIHTFASIEAPLFFHSKTQICFSKNGIPKKKTMCVNFPIEITWWITVFSIFALLSPCFFLLKSPFWVGKNPQFHPHFPSWNRLRRARCPLPRQPWWRSRRRSSDPQPSDVPRGEKNSAKLRRFAYFIPLNGGEPSFSSICFPEKTRSI